MSQYDEVIGRNYVVQATQGILAAVMAGNVCPDCGAPNHLRHFDECPQHPCNNGTCTGFCWTCNPRTS